MRRYLRGGSTALGRATAEPAVTVVLELAPVAAETLIRRYYAAFNERRLDDAQALLASDARLEHQAISPLQEGSDAYGTFARRWLTAFPDGQIAIQSIHAVGGDWYEVALLGDGTYDGDFDMGPLGVLRATHRRAQLTFRHLFEIRGGRITSSTLSFDTQELLRQLAP